jgi:hypothetical protein
MKIAACNSSAQNFQRPLRPVWGPNGFRIDEGAPWSLFRHHSLLLLLLLLLLLGMTPMDTLQIRRYPPAPRQVLLHVLNPNKTGSHRIA